MDQFGLAAALEWQLKEFGARSGLACHLDAPESMVEPAPEAAIALFRVFQECLTNVAHHARATEVRVRLAQEGDRVSLSVHDNGIGLVDAELPGRTTLGLLGMRERLRQVGGELTIDGRAGEGTTVLARVPLAAASVAAP